MLWRVDVVECKTVSDNPYPAFCNCLAKQLVSSVAWIWAHDKLFGSPICEEVKTYTISYLENAIKTLFGLQAFSIWVYLGLPGFFLFFFCGLYRLLWSSPIFWFWKPFTLPLVVIVIPFIYTDYTTPQEKELESSLEAICFIPLQSSWKY